SLRQLVDLRRQRMVLVEQHDLAAPDQEQRAVADADPFDAGRAEGGADQRATHAAQRRVLIDLGGNGLVGELHGLVEARRYIAGGRAVGGEEGGAGRAAGECAAGMATHPVGERRRQLGRAAFRAGRSRALVAGSGPYRRRVFLIAPRALACAARILEFHPRSTPSVPPAPTSRTLRRRTARTQA